MSGRTNNSKKGKKTYNSTKLLKLKVFFLFLLFSTYF